MNIRVGYMHIHENVCIFMKINAYLCPVFSFVHMLMV